jgi:pSer/pThr/pTyr-binding forkhead associated (FHA) protein
MVSGASTGEVAAPLVLALDWLGGACELVLGRGRGCDVELDDNTVSRRHARLRYRDGAWVIQDLGSTNGTRVNGRRAGRCQLRPGDRVALGGLVLQVD